MKTRVVLSQVLFWAVLAFVIAFRGAQFAIAQDTKEKNAAPANLTVAEQPHYLPGERWIYNRNGERYTIEFLRYEGDLAVTRRVRGDIREIWYSNQNGGAVKITDEDGKLLREGTEGHIVHQFPLTLGKQWHGTYFRGTVHRRIHAQVAAVEEVAVPAGRFLAFRIEIVNQRTDRERPAYETVWYAPAVKRVVRYFSRELKFEMELLEYIPANTSQR